MLLTLLNNLTPGSAARQWQYTGNAVSPHQYQNPLIAGAALFVAAVPYDAGALGTIQTFGAHAVALYNAEAEKSTQWPPVVSQPGGPALGSYFSLFEQPQPPRPFDAQVWAATAAPTVVTASAIGTFVSTQIGAERAFQPTPVSIGAAVAGPGFLGSFAYASWTPGTSTWQPAPVISEPLTAGPGFLGSFAWAIGQDPRQPAPVISPAVIAGPGFLGKFAWASPFFGSSTWQPAPWYEEGGLAPTVAGPGFLGTFASITAPQVEANRSSFVWPSLVKIPPPPISAPYYSVPESAQGPRTGWVWSSLVAGATPRIGAFAQTLEQFQDRPTVQVRASLISEAAEQALGAFFATPPQDPTQRPAVIWAAQPPAFGKLGQFVATLAQDPSQRPAVILAATAAHVVVVTGKLGQFAWVAEQREDKDRPTVSVRQAVQFGPLVPAGQVAEIVAWALSQTGIQPVRCAYLAGSGCFVYAEYFDVFGNPVTPAKVQYRVDQVYFKRKVRVTGQNIVPWTNLAPATQNRVYVTGAQNQMINLSRSSETHQVLFKVVDGSGDVGYARVLFDLIQAPS